MTKSSPASKPAATTSPAAAPAPNGWVRPSLADRRLRAEVSDPGPGVPANERTQLFREHARLSPRPTGGKKSNDLDLAIAIVKHLVESQNGTVSADFPATGGSIFWCEIPVA